MKSKPMTASLPTLVLPAPVLHRLLAVMSTRTGSALLAALVVFSCLDAPAATIGYWRFEGTGGDWLLDSSGNGHHLTANGSPSPTQYSRPSTGPGSAFPNPIPQTGQPNLAAAQLSGSNQWLTAADNNAFTSNTFTIEAFLNISTLSLASTPIVAGHFQGNENQRSWFFAIKRSDGKLQLAISQNGTAAEVIGSPNLALTAGKDYYAAIAVNVTDTSANGITFYLKNLTDGGPLLSEGATHTVTSLHNSTALFAIGSQGRPGGANFFPGIIDEVRFSNVVLPADQLIVAVPEPGALALAGLGVAFAGWRLRRRRPVGKKERRVPATTNGLRRLRRPAGFGNGGGRGAGVASREIPWGSSAHHV